MLHGLHCLHSRRIAHGDVNPGEFLMSIRPFSNEDIHKIRESCEASGRSNPVQRIDGKQDAWAPRYLYIDQPLTDLMDMELGMSAKLSDLGAAFDFEHPPAAGKCATPAALRAPEIVLNSVISHKTDIWSFGCLMYEFLTDRGLFQVSGLASIPQEENDDDHLLQMIDTLGHPPPEIFSRWPRRAKYFDENLQLIRSDVSSAETVDSELFQGPTIEQAFEESKPKDMGHEEQVQVLRLLRKILQYDPQIRPSVDELLHDEWFESIG